MGKHRRIIVRLAVFMIAGALINVLIAWACAYWVNPFEHGGMGTQAFIADPNLKRFTCWSVTRRAAFGSGRVIVMPDGTGKNPTINSMQAEIFPVWCNLRMLMDLRLAESNAAAEASGTPDRARAVMLVSDARGWPMRSLICTWDRFIPGITPTRPPDWSFIQSGIELPIYGGVANKGGLDYVRALPLQIWWPGFAVNTVLYAAIVWMLMAVPGTMRRRVRRRRGQCAACGYSLRGHAASGGEKCPECGATA